VREPVREPVMTFVVKPLSIRIVFCSLLQLLSSATHNTVLVDFSVESLHAIEKDVETTIAELMNDVDVSSPSDITWNILSKLNKAPLRSISQTL
jgi:hypothetical protein